LHDPLAELLGVAPGGLLDYSYADAVKLAGHSCPTVAGATREGTVGVLGMAAGLISGAAGEGGFKGIAGHYIKRLLRGALIPGAPAAHREAFARAWQERAERVLQPR
jgi:hypothetical protein